MTIRSKPYSPEGRDNWDRIFGNKETCLTCRWYDYYGRCLVSFNDEPCANYERKNPND